MKTKNIILGAVLALIGILMVAIPDACIKAVVVLVGAAAVAFSVYNLLVVDALLVFVAVRHGIDGIEDDLRVRADLQDILHQGGIVRLELRFVQGGDAVHSQGDDQDLRLGGQRSVYPWR